MKGNHQVGILGRLGPGIPHLDKSSTRPKFNEEGGASMTVNLEIRSHVHAEAGKPLPLLTTKAMEHSILDVVLVLYRRHAFLFRRACHKETGAAFL